MYGSSAAAFQRRTAPSKACAPGPTASYGSALPVGQVVAALMAGPRPVGDLVAAPAARRQHVRGEAVLLRGAVVVLLATGRLAPAPCARGSGKVVARLAREALGVRIVERQRVEREVVRAEIEGGPQCRLPAGDRLPRDVVQEVEVDRADAGRPCRRHGRGHVPRGVAPPEAPQLARRPCSARRMRRGSLPRRRRPRGRRARRGRGWPRASPPRPAPARSDAEPSP